MSTEAFVRQDALTSHLAHERRRAKDPGYAQRQVAARARSERIRALATSSGLRADIDALYDDGRVPDDEDSNDEVTDG